jgi:predicted acylesterase/phospholipase RssA
VSEPQIPLEELRFAVVLNGGVSLAVWMGGVAHEINALSRAVGADAGRPTAANRSPTYVYQQLLEAVRCRARVDVISGTSAGGINGVALALDELNPAARLSDLRDIWADQGDMHTRIAVQQNEYNPSVSPICKLHAFSFLCALCGSKGKAAC